MLIESNYGCRAISGIGFRSREYKLDDVDWQLGGKTDTKAGLGVHVGSGRKCGYSGSHIADQSNLRDLRPFVLDRIRFEHWRKQGQQAVRRLVK